MPKAVTNIDKLPLIGWYARRQLGFVIFCLIAFFIYYYFFYKYQNTIISYGCQTNACKATPCYGPECTGDNCIGNGCHAGSCYGEGCQGGTCEGVGCKGGDCYGTNCMVGRCKDPNCSDDRQRQGLCVPNCSWGRAHKIVKSGSKYVYKIKRSLHKYLPFNTYFNQNLCIKPFKITENLIKDAKTLYNMNLKGAYYYNGEFLSINEINEKIAKGTIIDDKKGLVRYNDPIIETIPNIYRNENCDWCALYNNKELCSNTGSVYTQLTSQNVLLNDMYWGTFLTPVVEFDNKGIEMMCPMLLMKGPHNFDYANMEYFLDIEQIKQIVGLQTFRSRVSNSLKMIEYLQNNNINELNAYIKNTDFLNDTYTIDTIVQSLEKMPSDKKMEAYNKMENVFGTVMKCVCSNCSKVGNRTLIIDYFPTDIYGNVIPCKERLYTYDKIEENYDPGAVIDKSRVSYKLLSFEMSKNNKFDENEKKLFSDKLHSIKNHHLMVYLNTDINNNVVTYICLFCMEKSTKYIEKFITVPNKTNITIIDSCTNNIDYDHYIVELLEGDSVHHSCIKCNKKV